MTDCLFCKIVAGEIPTDKVYEDDEILAFKDIAPKAPFHVLVIPKKHVVNLEDLRDEDAALIGRIHLVIRDIARQAGIASNGYKVITNCGAAAGQVVFHIHFHILGNQNLNIN